MAGFWRRLLGGERAPEEPAEPPERRREKRRPVVLKALLEWRDAAGNLSSADGVIRDISESGLQVECRRGFSVNQVIEVDDNRGSLSRFVVRHCRRAENGQYLIGLMVLKRERRRELRIAVSGEAAVRKLDEVERSENHQVRVRDMSAGGMQILAKRRLALGEPVRVEGAEVSCVAATRYCEPVQGGFLIGIQFLQDPAIERC